MPALLNEQSASAFVAVTVCTRHLKCDRQPGGERGIQFARRPSGLCKNLQDFPGDPALDSRRRPRPEAADPDIPGSAVIYR